MVIDRHARDRPIFSMPSAYHGWKGQTRGSEAKKIQWRQTPHHPRENLEALSCWPHKGDSIPWFVDKYCVGKEGQRKVKDVCWLHWFVQGLSQGYSYPLPSIDSLVDNTSCYRLLSFLDALSGYNKICMHPKDESKTTFMDEVVSYCYKVMSFSLKFFGTTYQRLMDRILSPNARAKRSSICRRHGRHVGKERPTYCQIGRTICNNSEVQCKA